MPLTCVEPDAVLADEPDHFAGIEAALVRLGRRTNGRPGETIAGLLQEYGRLDAGLRQKYTAACQGWTVPCDPAQAAAYQASLVEVRARNGQLRDLYAAVEALASKTGWIEPGDEAAKGLLRDLEVAVEALDHAGHGTPARAPAGDPPPTP